MKVLLSTIALSTMLISCGGEKNKSGSNDVISSSNAEELKSIISAELWGTSWEGVYNKEGQKKERKPDNSDINVVFNFLSVENLLMTENKSKGKVGEMVVSNISTGINQGSCNLIKSSNVNEFDILCDKPGGEEFGRMTIHNTENNFLDVTGSSINKLTRKEVSQKRVYLKKVVN